MKIWKIIFYILGIIPWFCIVSLMTFYFHAGKILGYLPRYNMPDPKVLTIYNDYASFIRCSFAIWFYSFITCFILAIIYLIINRKKINPYPIIFAFIGNIIALRLLFSGIFEWFVD
jgi:hypothetical protein